ncbi:MAG: hypothetical protein ABR529_15090 [Actinomycetota bacterium]
MLAQRPLEAESLDGALLTRAIEGLRKSFEVIIVDTGPALDEFTVSVLAECDLAYLVTSLELPAIKDTKVLLAAFDRLGLDIDKVRLILNRANSKVGFPPEEVAKALGRRTVADLPSDVAVPRSVNNGVAVAVENPKAKISRSLEELSTSLRKELTTGKLAVKRCSRRRGGAPSRRQKRPMSNRSRRLTELRKEKAADRPATPARPTTGSPAPRAGEGWEGRARCGRERARR